MQNPNSEIRLAEDAFIGALDVRLDLPLAGPGSRGLAALLDSLVLFVIYAFLGIAQALAIDFLPELSGGFVLALIVLLVFLVQFVYFVAFELAADGQTPGKRALGLRVVQDDGSSVTPLGSLVRTLLRPADFFPGGYGCGLIAVLATAKSQRLGDLAGGTVVVREAGGSVRNLPLAERIPPGLPAADVALLEAYLRAAKWLAPARRTAIAAGMRAWLERVDPKAAATLPLTDDPEMTLAAWLAPPAPPQA